jgi:D-alanyl-D-alanine carboxypeptidase/D-alanyl-D-alanine-endopeptidase (penicillin-binding protein 4)
MHLERAATVLRAILIPTLFLLVATVTSSGELRGLATVARSILGADQGVYVEASDGTPLLAQAAARPVHPASVSKVPTTLALLRKLGPEYRFVTTFTASGPIHEGTLDGDMWVESDGDPYFVDEDALLVVERLNALGITRVTGTLRPRGALTFDWQSDIDAVRLRQAMSGMAPAAAWAVVRALDAANAMAPVASLPLPPRIQFASVARGANLEVAESLIERPLVVHRSQPLVPLAKALNDYSNNIFQPLADAAGGAAAVESLARSVVPAAMRSEIELADGAGTDPRNRLSPRAAVKLLRALEQQLAASGYSLFDILPVAGIDEGTLRQRMNAPGEAGRVVGKTGTFGDYGASALIGAVATSDRGTVYFAILNHGVPVPEARRRQDRFLRALLGRLQSVRWNYQRDLRPAVARAEVFAAP